MQESRTLAGCQTVIFPQCSRTPSGCNFAFPPTGGLRYASTTGYFLSTLRVEVPTGELSIPIIYGRARFSTVCPPQILTTIATRRGKITATNRRTARRSFSATASARSSSRAVTETAEPNSVGNG